MAQTPEQPKPAWVNSIAAIALIFSAMTLFSGGSVLFINGHIMLKHKKRATFIFAIVLAMSVNSALAALS